jgi:hypothetical protein
VYICTCDKLYPDLCSYYFGNGDNDTDVVVFPLFHITDSQHNSSHSLQELLLYWDQPEASEPVTAEECHKRLISKYLLVHNAWLKFVGRYVTPPAGNLMEGSGCCIQYVTWPQFS